MGSKDPIAMFGSAPLSVTSPIITLKGSKQEQSSRRAGVHMVFLMPYESR